MRDEVVASRTVRCLAGGCFTVFVGLAGSIGLTGAALAFPFVDPTNQDTLPTGAPQGTELPAPDVTGLGNQLRLVDPAAPGNPSAWTIVPRLTIQELFTDNALEVTAPRRFDAITVVAPGISIVANTSRLQLNLDYQPNLLLHAIEGPLNSLSQQLNMTGLVTVVPDLAFVDLRAVSGVQSRYGALAGNGTIGNGNAALASAATTAGGYGGQAGTNPQNEVQTSSIGISPYLLRQFGDYGTGKIGVSVDASHSSSINGFVADPLPGGGGANDQTLVTTEQIASFTTGQFLGKLQDSLLVDLSQSSTQYGGGTALVSTPEGTTTTTTIGAQNVTSQRQTITNQINYALNRTITLLTSFGEQQITYSNNAAAPITGPTWSVGMTITPSPNSSLTVTYGHLNGANSIQANGYIALTGRMQLSANYSNTVGTQLENLQNQLNNSVSTPNGGLVNAQTGGQNFLATNAIGLAAGVYRFATLNISLSTQWARDQVQASGSWSVQTNLTPGNTQSGYVLDPTTGQPILINQLVPASGQSTDIRTFDVTWTHELSPDLTLSTSGSYSFIRRVSTEGNDSSLATAIGLQYMLSASTAVSARYSFFDRVSKIPGYSLYENTLLLGFTKQF